MKFEQSSNELKSAMGNPTKKASGAEPKGKQHLLYESHAYSHMFLDKL